MFQYFLHVLLTPIFLIQALYVKRKVIKLPEASGNRVNNLKNDISLAVIGDSVAAGVGLEHIDFALAGKLKHELSHRLNNSVDMNVMAKTGDKLKILINKLTSEKYSASLSSKYVVVSIGVNDVTSLTSTYQWRKQVTALCELFSHGLQKRRPEKLIFIAIPPMEKFPLLPFPLSFLFGQRANILNRITRSITEEYSYITFLSINMSLDHRLFAEDGFHPSEKGCELLAKEISGLLCDDVIN